jgi:hypothetical protein
MKVILMMQNMAVMVHLIGVKRLAVATLEMVAAAMKKRTRRGFCCCRSYKGILDSQADYLLHLSYDGYCGGGADRVVREIARIILNSR